VTDFTMFCTGVYYSCLVRLGSVDFSIFQYGFKYFIVNNYVYHLIDCFSWFAGICKIFQ
jgi:hypothetical protein